MKKVSRIITTVFLALVILLTVSCEHNVYMYDGIDNIWYVDGNYFATLQAAMDYIYSNSGTEARGISRAMNDVPVERTALLLRDVTNGERGGGLIVPADFKGMLTIDFGGHIYEFDDSLDHFFEVLGGDEVYITNGTTVIYNEASHEPFAIAINTDTLTIDSHLIDDRRVDPIDSSKSDAKLAEVGEKGNLVVKDVPGQEGARLTGVISVVTDGKTGGKLSLNGSRVVISNIFTKFKDDDGNIHDTIPVEKAIPEVARSVINVNSGQVSVLDINSPSDYKNGVTLYEKAVLNIIKAEKEKETEVDNPHGIDYVIAAIVSQPESKGVDHEIIHEYSTIWENDESFHWHACIVCGAESEHEIHEFTEWRMDEDYNWIRDCLICGLEQKETHVHTLDRVAPVSPTCTETGNIEYWRCSVCSKLYLDDEGVEEATLADVTIAATGHSWSEKWTHDGTDHWHECENGCGAKNDTAAHSFNDWAYDTSDGKDHRDCSVCDHEESRDHVHVLSAHAEKDATCTEDGNKAYWECIKCGRYYLDTECTQETTKEGTVIPATGHEWSTGWYYNDDLHWHACLHECGSHNDEGKHDFGEERYNPETGKMEKECKICHMIVSEGHTHSSDTWITTDPTSHYKICDECGTEFDRADHEYEDWTYDSDSGKDKSTCDICGRNEYRIHVHGTEEAGTLTHTPAKAATCEEDGNIEYWHCLLCDCYFQDEELKVATTLEDTVIEKLGHKITHVPAVEAVCNKDGNIEYWHCDRCGKYYSDEALEHEITQEQTVTHDPDNHSLEHFDAVIATCMHQGNIEYWHCTRCEKYFSDEACTDVITYDDAVIAKKDHVFIGSPWYTDEEGHWHECIYSCGTIADYGEHDEGTEYEKNSQYHWHACTVCGRIMSEPEAHQFVEQPSEPGVFICTVCYYIDDRRSTDFDFHATGLDPEPKGTVSATKDGKSWTVTVEVTSDTEVTSYEWYVDNKLQKGETSASFTFTPPRKEDYTVMCVFGNEAGYFGSASMKINGGK